MDERRRRYQGVRQTESWDFAAEQAGPFGDPPVDRKLLHAGEQSAHLRFVVLRPSKELGASHHRVRQPTCLPR